MKKYSILLSAAFAIFALASCQKEQEVTNTEVIDNAPKSVPFVLRANIPSVDTKTTLNTSTWAVDWEDTDVIYAVTTDEAWGEAYPVEADETIAEFAYDYVNGTFSTDKDIADGSHTFNFLYTAGQQKSYHRGASTTFQLAGAQTFDASDPTASLKLYDALAAQVIATTPTSFADVDMSHLFSLMKVTLNNKTGADVTISKFEVEIPGENLYGIFDVAFGATPSVSYNKNGGAKISVNISNGTVANNGSLDVYFVMGPVSGYTGEVTFTVTDSASNTYTKTNTISAPGVSFAAGTYNTASYTLKTADPIECVTLDWNYAGGTSADLNAVPGVTTNGLGSDYAESHAPNRVKFDGTGDYIQVRTDAAIQTVSVGYKMIGGGNTSYLNIYESTNGTTWGERIDRLTISGASSSIGTVSTTAVFNAASRFVKIEFEKGSNVGIGTLSITKKNTNPTIVAADINDVPAVGRTDEDATYSVLNFVDDVEVGSYTGCVSDAVVASSGNIIYSVSPNYASTPAAGTIVLWSAADHSVTKTINVHQLASSLSVSKTEVIIPANDDEASFTITSPEFAWSISADDDTHVLYDNSGSASNSPATVTVTSDVAATGVVQTIATLTIIRNSNNSDPQAKQVVIKKAAAGVQSYTITFANSANSAIAISSSTNASTVISDDGSRTYVTSQPFTVNSGNVYYGDTQTCIRIGKSGNASSLSIALSATGQVTAKSIVVNCNNTGGSKNSDATLNVNSIGKQTTTDSASDYTFTFGSATAITSITLEGSASIRIYSITVNY